ncbi:hypothetical protein [Flavihumibacter sp. UBA7668]|uniref:hypothetical protein n=1 Tax=Flavihumibacter sp. UBA7668 TaxID=1946542 RepID=UPI0025BC8333|nr:hypothetical protein [Flavihumibacter sp. UBA7668]
MHSIEPLRNCLWCKDALRGRSDKKFCDSICRNAYNNKLEHSSANLIKTINYALRRNRNILADIYEQAAPDYTVSKEVLVYKGFQFKYHTEVIDLKNPVPLFVCYDFGYQVLPEEQVQILPISKDLFGSWHSANGSRRGDRV